jgi:glutathione S-transferase
MSLTFYTHPMSRGRIVRWMLEEVGQPYETVVLDYGTTMKGPEYRAINPMGKVPALKHGDAVITECAAICAYLADAFPEAGLAPPLQGPERAAYYRWMFFAAGPVEAAVTNRALGVEVAPERTRMVGYGTFAEAIDALEQRLLAAPYFAGEHFSAADVYAGSQILWGMQFGSIDARPAFQEYAARVMARPAYARGNDKDNALLPPG